MITRFSSPSTTKQHLFPSSQSQPAATRGSNSLHAPACARTPVTRQRCKLPALLAAAGSRHDNHRHQHHMEHAPSCTRTPLGSAASLSHALSRSRQRARAYTWSILFSRTPMQHATTRDNHDTPCNASTHLLHPCTRITRDPACNPCIQITFTSANVTSPSICICVV